MSGKKALGARAPVAAPRRRRIFRTDLQGGFGDFERERFGRASRRSQSHRRF